MTPEGPEEEKMLINLDREKIVSAPNMIESSRYQKEDYMVERRTSKESIFVQE